MAVYGVYRGVCVDNRDPLAQGRVRVIVPQVLGSAASGWAFPSWGMDDLTTWPEDRLPKPGQGVWVLFEGADRLTWISAFGPQEFSEQHKEDDPDYYKTKLEMELSILPVGIPVPVTGVLSSPAGIPWPGALVKLQKVTGGYQMGTDGKVSIPEADWVSVGTGEVDPDGLWSVDYARPSGEDGWWYRASYTGIEPYISSASEPEQVPVPEDTSVLTWNDPFPQWQKPIQIKGLFVAGSDGVGIRNQPVHLYVRVGSGPWYRDVTVLTDAKGAWSFNWTRTKAMTAEVQMRMVYLGSVNWDYSQVPDPYKELAQVQVPVSISWFPPQSIEIGVPMVFTGMISSAYGLPEPGPVVTLQVRSPSAQVSSNGVWTDMATAGVHGDGTWSLNFTPTKATGDYRVHFPGTGVYLPATTEEISQVLYLATTTSTPSIPSLLYFGTAFLVTGTVVDEKNRPVTNGVVRLEMRLTTGPNTEWGTISVALDTDVNPVNGEYSITHVPPTLVGGVQYRVKYLDNPDYGYQSSVSPVITTIIKLRTPVLTKGAVTHNSASFSWTSVPGAAKYLVHEQPDGATTWAYREITETSHTVTELSANSNYNFYVSAVRTGADGWHVTSDSTIIKCKTGSPAGTNAGSFEKYIAPAATNSWRDGTPGTTAAGWTIGIFGDQVVHGKFGTSGRYQGLMTYDGLAFRNWVVQNYGQAVLNNIGEISNWTSTQIHMQREGVAGSDSAINLIWYVTSGVAGSGSGPFSWAGGDQLGSFTKNQAAWVTLQSHWAKHVLLNENVAGTGVTSSFMVMQDSTVNYGRFYGAASGLCTLYVACRWSFQTVAATAGRWY